MDVLHPIADNSRFVMLTDRGRRGDFPTLHREPQFAVDRHGRQRRGAVRMIGQIPASWDPPPVHPKLTTAPPLKHQEA